MRRGKREVHELRLNFYQRAKLANAFKWRLIENGVERKVADEVTQSLVVDLSANRGTVPEAPATVTSVKPAAVRALNSSPVRIDMP